MKYCYNYYCSKIQQLVTSNWNPKWGWFIVGCWGVVQLGVPTPWFAWRCPSKVGTCKSILCTERFHVVEIKNTSYSNNFLHSSYFACAIKPLKPDDLFVTLYSLSLCCNALCGGKVSQLTEILCWVVDIWFLDFGPGP